MKEVAYDDPQLPVVKLWWLIPSPAFGNSIKDTSMNVCLLD
jgi:hypothetical protein